MFLNLCKFVQLKSNLNIEVIIFYRKVLNKKEKKSKQRMRMGSEKDKEMKS